MDTYKCEKCQKIINIDNREIHEMSCLYTFSLEDYQNLIPCELCEDLINIEDYQNHVTNCINASRYIPLNTPIQAATQSQANADLVNMYRNILEQVNPQNQNNQPPNHENHEVNDSELSNENVDQQPPLLNINIDNPNEILNMLLGAYYTENINPLFNVFNLPNQEHDETYEDLINLGNTIGDVEVGVSDINKVSKIDFKEINCSICSEDAKIIRRTTCNHEFCLKCLTRWLESKKTCPICMIELE